ncbi:MULTISPECIES: hypothetical protein [unclassified Nocardioides]|uniref:hypothetical protein n=1 Tax=unclassified Nocardioides TaxID=2615069 RepID=UPI000AD7D48C|nr:MULTISPECIES: hypothetical protein [unclassified Nocardioides]
MGPRMRLLNRWVREFAAGVDAGHAIRHGRRVPADSAARHHRPGRGARWDS